MRSVNGFGTMSQALGEETGKESPVLIENVSVIINVFNIGHGGDGDVARSQLPTAEFLPSLVDTCNVPGDNGLLDASGSHGEGCGQKGEDYSKKALPLGWIACHNGSVIPFGIQPIATEIPSFGDRATWKEIRVCLPPSLFPDTESDLYCPVPSCREKLFKNKSMDTHIKKHLGFKSESSPTPSNDNLGKLPCPLSYYCQDKSCQYNVESAEKWFKAYKNLKQHYIKVHAPKLFECDMCRKTFSTLKIAETHKLMCGEKYCCSTCNASYNSLEALQTHCRRKSHAYDHVKYKDKRNSVKHEMQMHSTKVTPPPPAPTPSSGSRKTKAGRKLPPLLPKGLTTTNSNEVFKTIQAFCQQAGVKVDYGCQTVCSAFVQKSNPFKAVVTSPEQSFAQKKRKSTDTQTNIVKFRATCLDQRHNATNTNVDWKTVVTSDSQTQTAELNEPVDLSCAKTSDAAQFNDEFATIKISETIPKVEPVEPELDPATTVVELKCSEIPAFSEEPAEDDADEEPKTISDEKGEIKNISHSSTSTSTIKVANGPSLFSEFISFLEATDSATQTDPDMFDILGGDCLGIDVNLDNISGNEKNVYVSVSSTASQTAVESVSSTSLSAEDYEALLNADDKKLADLHAFSEYIKTVEAIGCPNSCDDGEQDGHGLNGNDLLFDWENIVEEVYHDIERTKNSQS